MTTTVMPKAVLDSSVLISAFLTPKGACAELLEAGYAGQFVLALSLEIVAETMEKLLRKHKLQALYGYDRAKVKEYARQLLAAAELSGELPNLTGIVPNDPKDDMVVATAVAAGANYLVAGD